MRRRPRRCRLGECPHRRRRAVACAGTGRLETRPFPARPRSGRAYNLRVHLRSAILRVVGPAATFTTMRDRAGRRVVVPLAILTLVATSASAQMGGYTIGQVSCRPSSSRTGGVVTRSCSPGSCRPSRIEIIAVATPSKPQASFRRSSIRITTVATPSSVPATGQHS